MEPTRRPHATERDTVRAHPHGPLERKLALCLSVVLSLPVALGALACADPAEKFAAMDGEALFKHSCASCHGSDGRAPGGAAPNFRGKRDDWSVDKIVEYIDDPQAYKKKAGIARLGRKVMPPVNRRMPEDARRRLAEHVIELMDALRVR